MTRIIIAALVLMAILLPLGEGAFAGTERYFCEYRVHASPDGLKETNDFRLEFVIDGTTGKAVIIGNNGLETVAVVREARAITFLEALASGAVQSTTIVLDTMETVHSRHSILLSDLVPSQYYGQCKVLKK
jgi:hypothetical protein